MVIFNIKNIVQLKFFQHVMCYASFSVLQKCIPFLLYPLFARIFQEAEVGYYVLYQSIYFLSIPVLTLSTETSISVNFYRLSQEEFAKYLTNVWMMVSGYFLIGIVILFAFLDKIAFAIQFPKSWFILTIISVYPRFIINILLIIFRNQNEALKYGIISALSTILNNAIGLYFIFGMDMNWQGIVLGILMGDLIVSIFSFYWLFHLKLIHFKLIIDYWIDSLKMSVPVCLHVIGGWLSSTLNRFFITVLIGVAATGSYGIASTFAMILNLVVDSFNLAFAPYVFQRLSIFSPKDKRDIVWISLFYYCFIVVSTLIIMFIAWHWLVSIYGIKYETVKVFIIPLILAAALNGFYKVHVNCLFFSKKTYLITMVTFGLGLCNIGLSYLMISRYGMLGSAYSSVIISWISYMLIVYLANKQYPLNWLRNGRLLFYSLVKK